MLSLRFTSAGENLSTGLDGAIGENAIRGAQHTLYRIRTTMNAIKLANQPAFGSIAFPLIGAGTGGGSAHHVLDRMRDKLSKADYDGRVIIVQFQNS